MSRGGAIDGMQFARDREVVSGTLDLADLGRLAESGCAAAEVRYEVGGGANAKGRPSLRIVAAGHLTLECQRCLGPVDLPLALQTELELATDPREVDAAEDDVDRVLATRAMEVAGLVEDEILLALPMAPMHERCEPADAAAGQQERSPFAALAGLRKGGDGRG